MELKTIYERLVDIHAEYGPIVAEEEIDPTDHNPCGCEICRLMQDISVFQSQQGIEAAMRLAESEARN